MERKKSLRAAFLPFPANTCEFSDVVRNLDGSLSKVTLVNVLMGETCEWLKQLVVA